MSTRSWKGDASRRAQVAGVWLALLLAWELAYRLIGWRAWIFPAPSHVLDALLGLLNVRVGLGEPLGAGWPWAVPGQIPSDHSARVVFSPLVHAMAVSGVRLVVGFGACLGLGLLLGVTLWRWRFVNSVLGPLFLGLQTLPSVCWVPLAVLTLGIGERGVLFVLVMGSAFSMAIAMRDGLASVPPIYRAAGLMLGATGSRLYTHVLLPACLPALAGTLRQGFSFAWRSLLGAELILLTQNRGLGFLLAAGRDFNDVAQVVAMVAVMIGIGMAMDRCVFARIERRVAVRFGLARD